MSLLRWSVVLVLVFAGGVSPTTLASPTQRAPSVSEGEAAGAGFARMALQVETRAVLEAEPRPEQEPRVEIGSAVVFIYDASGRVIATE